MDASGVPEAGRRAILLLCRAMPHFSALDDLLDLFHVAPEQLSEQHLSCVALAPPRLRPNVVALALAPELPKRLTEPLAVAAAQLTMRLDDAQLLGFVETLEAFQADAELTGAMAYAGAVLRSLPSASDVAPRLAAVMARSSGALRARLYDCCLTQAASLEPWLDCLLQEPRPAAMFATFGRHLETTPGGTPFWMVSIVA